MRRGTKNATHHTLSLFLMLRLPPALPALGAGGMPEPCDVAAELRAAVVLSVECAEVTADGRGDDVTLAGAEVGTCEEGARLLIADESEDIALEAAEARDEAALDAEDGAVTSVVRVEVAEPEAGGTVTEVGTWEARADVAMDDGSTGTLDAGGGIPGVKDGKTPGVYEGITPGVDDGITPGM
jgi:hypothetical protein